MSNSMSKEVPNPVVDVWRLTDVDITFVSACPRGANPGAKILLKKELVMAGKSNFAKEDNNPAGGVQPSTTPITVNFDGDSFAKSVGESLKNALSDILKQDKITPEAAAEACSAVLAGDLAKMQKDMTDQLTTQVAEIQKQMDSKLADLNNKAINKDADETVTVNGVSFAKSAVGDATFAALKASIAQSEAIRKELEDQKLQARVEKEYPNVAGDVSLKAQLLGMIEKCGDDKLKEFGLGVLKSLNDTSAEYTKEIGSSGNGHTADSGVTKMASDTDASLKLDALAKELAAKENISISAAYAKVLKTEEGAKLYNQHCAG